MEEGRASNSLEASEVVVGELEVVVGELEVVV